MDTVSQQGSVYSILSEDYKTFCPAFSPQKIRLNSKIYDDKTLSIKIGNWLIKKFYIIDIVAIGFNKYIKVYQKSYD